MKEELLRYFNNDELAASVWLGKYAVEGEITPDDMHMRMANEFAKIEVNYWKDETNHKDLSEYGSNRFKWFSSTQGDFELIRDQIYGLFKDFKYIVPQGSIMAMLGHPTNIGSLSNCFKGDVPVLTRDGWKAIGTFAGKDVEIMTKGGGWVIAPFKSYGEQKLWDVTLSNGNQEQTIKATKDHRWALYKKSKPETIHEIKPTINLKEGDVLYATYGKNRNWKLSAIGVAHGITYGDGHSVKGDDNCNNITLCSESRILSKFFPESYVSTDESNCEGGSDFYSGLPNYFRELPNIRENKSYLYGWLSGYFAADGHIDEKGAVMICSSKSKDITFVKDVCGVLGIGCTQITEQTVISNLTNKEHTMYKCFIHKNHLSEDFFLLGKHKSRFNQTDKSPARWKVISVIETNDIDEVYCAEVPNTESFVIEGNILSMNCFVVGQPYDSYAGILHKDQQLVQLMKRRGGVGLDISTLRPATTIVKNAAGTSTGAVSFMDRFSNTTREVAQSGRRGALMLTIDVRHPDVFDFVNIKKDRSKVTGANISVMLRDDFMEAVKKDEDYVLRWPCDADISVIENDTRTFEYGKLYPFQNTRQKNHYYKIIKAKELYNSIVDNAWDNAEPGQMFIDRHWDYSPDGVYEAYKGVTTNPCFPENMRLLTKNGYETFGSLEDSKLTNEIFTDNRIIYVGTDNNEDWEINNNNHGVKLRNASEVFVTSESSEVIRLTFSDGSELECTTDHHVATTNGMVMAGELTPDHDILVAIPDLEFDILGKLPTTNDEKCALLMGLIAGDGTFGPQCKINIDLWGDDRYTIRDICLKLIDDLYITEYDVIKPLIGNEWVNRKLSNYFVSDIKKSNKVRIGSNFLSKYLEIKYGFTSKTKLQIPEFILNNCRGNIGLYYLQGLYYADGSVQGSIKSGYTVRLHQSNKKMLSDVQLICHANGIKTSIYSRRLPHEKEIKGKKYKIKEQYELITTNNSHVEFNKIGFLGSEKEIKLKIILSETPKIKHNKTTVKLINTENLGYKKVFCLKEDVTRSCIVNTISVRRCGEIFMQEYDACRLMAINLFNIVFDSFTENASINEELLYELSYEQQRLADALIDLEIEYIDRILNKIKEDSEPMEVKQIEYDLWKNIQATCRASRRTGCGFTALGDMLAALNLKYDSDEAMEVIERVMHIKMKAELDCTIDLAILRGPFEGWDFNKEYDDQGWGKNEFYKFVDEEYGEAIARMKKYGRRNCSFSTVAPTGTVSLMTQTSSGLEPIFMPYYMRRKKVNPSDGQVRVDFVDQNGDSWQEYPVLHPKFLKWCESKNSGNTMRFLQTLDKDTLKGLFELSPWYGSTANDIDWIKRVEIQAIIQKYVSHSISSTINLPSEATKEEVSTIYMSAFDAKLKGVTIYRDGCRTGVLVSTDSVGSEDIFEYRDAIKRPKMLPGHLFNVTALGDKFHVAVGLMNDKPYETFAFRANGKIPPTGEGFIKKIKSGSYSFIQEDKEFLLTDKPTPIQEALTKLLSWGLRSGGHIKYAVDVLNSTDSDLMSFEKAVARTLKRFIAEGEKSSVKCWNPECTGDGSNVVFEEGCVSCKDCGASKCS